MGLKYCVECKRNVNPTKEFSWLGLIFLSVIYLIYYAFKSPRCPICKNTNFQNPK